VTNKARPTSAVRTGLTNGKDSEGEGYENERTEIGYRDLNGVDGGLDPGFGFGCICGMGQLAAGASHMNGKRD